MQHSNRGSLVSQQTKKKGEQEETVTMTKSEAIDLLKTINGLKKRLESKVIKKA